MLFNIEHVMETRTVHIFMRIIMRSRGRGRSVHDCALISISDVGGEFGGFNDWLKCERQLIERQNFVSIILRFRFIPRDNLCETSNFWP